MKDLQTQLQKAIDHLKHVLSSMQLGRASAALVQGVQVEQYGSMGELKACANISVPDAQTLRVEPWDKSLIGAIEKAIQAANLGLNPTNMGEHLLISIPPLTEERRKQVVKQVHAEVEKAKIGVRNARQDALKQVKSQKDEKEISEDELKKAEKEIQAAVDAANKEVEAIGKKKETDVLSV